MILSNLNYITCTLLKISLLNYVLSRLTRHIYASYLRALYTFFTRLCACNCYGSTTTLVLTNMFCPLCELFWWTRLCYLATAIRNNVKQLIKESDFIEFQNLKLPKRWRVPLRHLGFRPSLAKMLPKSTSSRRFLIITG